MSHHRAIMFGTFAHSQGKMYVAEYWNSRRTLKKTHSYDSSLIATLAS